MPAFTFTMATGCEYGAGFVDILTLRGGGDGAAYSYELTGQSGTSYSGGVVTADLPLRLAPLPPDNYMLLVSYLNPDNSGSGSSRDFESNCSGGGQPGRLALDSLRHTDETAVLNDGTASIQASGGTPPLTAELVELLLSQPATSGQPSAFPALPPARYTLRVTDSSAPQQVVSGQVEVLPYLPPKVGCQDEYADNYDPAATSGGFATCSYTPLWRSAWQPMAVRVAAQAGQTEAFIVAELRIGFRPGHPLAAQRPLSAPLRLRATVGPDGYATFVLGPYLHPALGAPDGYGGYRLDLNSQTVDDSYVGYELRRAMSGQLFEHGYAVNAAVPDAFLFDGALLTAFAAVPTWPGYSWKRAKLVTRTMKFGGIDEVYPSAVSLPCPLNPLPVAWLNPQGGFDFWVFQNRPQLGDTVSDGQQYREALTSELRYSDPGQAYQTYKASSGVFKGDALLTGLRTLWRSPQAWAQLVPGGDWVAIVVERGNREVGRLGVAKNEVQLSFQEQCPSGRRGNEHHRQRHPA